jgi:hypothetical protein
MRKPMTRVLGVIEAMRRNFHNLHMAIEKYNFLEANGYDVERTKNSQQEEA